MKLTLTYYRHVVTKNGPMAIIEGLLQPSVKNDNAVGNRVKYNIWVDESMFKFNNQHIGKTFDLDFNERGYLNAIDEVK